jgi:hypothetical protein
MLFARALPLKGLLTPPSPLSRGFQLVILAALILHALFGNLIMKTPAGQDLLYTRSWSAAAKVIPKVTIGLDLVRALDVVQSTERVTRTSGTCLNSIFYATASCIAWMPWVTTCLLALSTPQEHAYGAVYRSSVTQNSQPASKIPSAFHIANAHVYCYSLENSRITVLSLAES